MTIHGYLETIKNNIPTADYVFSTATNCRDAYTLIQLSAKNGIFFDFVLLDHGLPDYGELAIQSGGDLVQHIRRMMPETYVIVVTAHTEVIIVYDIVKNKRPDGLVIKKDLSPSLLPIVLKEVAENKTYHSLTVKECVKEIWKKDLMIDDFNRQILIYLSKGYKIKDLEQIVCLSTSSIQKRIIKMKTAFDADDESGLVKQAILSGYI